MMAPWPRTEAERQTHLTALRHVEVSARAGKRWHCTCDACRVTRKSLAAQGDLCPLCHSPASETTFPICQVHLL